MKKYDLSKFHIFTTISFDSNESMKLINIPNETVSGHIRDVSGIKFATLKWYTKHFEGGYGILVKGLWNGVPCIIKSPKGTDYLGNEALIQWHVGNTLKKCGLETTVPEVYGIFKNLKGKLCFAMEFIQGCFPHELLFEVTDHDTFFLQFLAQVCVILHVLENELNLDHRDLKANNLFIRKRPVSYSVIIRGKHYTVEAPFQVVLLDFGFACLGDENGVSKVNLSTSNFPNNDPCPKDGRDLFQLLISFWSISVIRNLFSPELQKTIDGWLQCEKVSYNHLSKTIDANHGAMVVAREPTFHYPELTPDLLLEKIDTFMSLNPVKK